MSSAVDRVRQLIVGINQDVISYQQMEQLLKAQNGNLVRRDNSSIRNNNEQQMKLLSLLRQRANQRSQLLRSLGLQANSDGLKRLANRLPDAASTKLLTLWDTLETRVGHCKKLNDYNGRLLANQQLVLKKLLNSQENFYQPTDSIA